MSGKQKSVKKDSLNKHYPGKSGEFVEIIKNSVIHRVRRRVH